MVCESQKITNPKGEIMKTNREEDWEAKTQLRGKNMESEITSFVETKNLNKIKTIKLKENNWGVKTRKTTETN